LTGAAMPNKDSRPDGPVHRADAVEGAYRWLTRDQTGHPAQLLGCDEVPSPLAVRGTLLPRDRGAVAVVGTRRASRYGETVARRLAAALAHQGVTVISGAARGIDSAAHEAALEAGGRTIAVLGEGLCAPTSAADPALLERIAAAGAVLSEFPAEVPPRRFTFPRRNRTLVALAARVVVVEAPLRSGALITAGFAIRLGRALYAVPGPIDHPGSAGPHRLLREGASLLDDPEAFAAGRYRGPPEQARPQRSEPPRTAAPGRSEP